jgi:hypothetical protein
MRKKANCAARQPDKLQQVERPSRARRSDTPKNNFWLKLAKKAKKAQN